jgi:hypothetical protein
MNFMLPRGGTAIFLLYGNSVRTRQLFLQLYDFLLYGNILLCRILQALTPGMSRKNSPVGDVGF